MKSLLNYQLTPEQTELRDRVRSFVEANVKPGTAQREWLPNHSDRIPWDWIEALSDMGVRTLPVPEQFGGPGADVMTCCLVGEELAAGDLGLAVTFDQTWKFVPLITTACTEEQRQRHLPGFLSDRRHLLALGLHEDGAGSDHFLPYNVAPHGGKTTAALDGHGGWILNGRKTYVSNGGVAKLHVVLARTEPDTGGAAGLTAFFIPLGTPGFSVGRVEDKVGQRLVQNAELIFENCRVADSDRLGERGLGMRTTGLALRGRGMPEMAATAIGVARAAFEAALDHARTHVQGGTEIINHDQIALMLADMDLRIESARQLMLRAAWAADNGARIDRRIPEMAKEYASEMAISVCIRAMEVFGGAGIMLENPAQKYVRDALTFLHSEGTNQILRMRRANVLRSAT